LAPRRRAHGAGVSLGELGLRRDAEYYGVPQKYIVGDGYQSYITKSTTAANSFTVTGYQNVKRRIYLVQDEGTIRVIALGFRQADTAAIESWASNGEPALLLDIDPNEVDVRWLTPALKPTGL
jgi:hypothetical protein